VAAGFCFAYITKPVVVSYAPFSDLSESSNPITPVPVTHATPPAEIPPEVKPKSQTGTTKQQLPPAPLTSGFEETNIRMQHILDAESPGGDIHRIVIDVPVLYKSRNLRWSQDDTAQARVLLQRSKRIRKNHAHCGRRATSFLKIGISSWMLPFPIRFSALTVHPFQQTF
jgi:hypothetical protein